MVFQEVKVLQEFQEKQEKMAVLENQEKMAVQEVQGKQEKMEVQEVQDWMAETEEMVHREPKVSNAIHIIKVTAFERYLFNCQMFCK